MGIAKKLICKIKGHDQIKTVEHGVTLLVGHNSYGQLGTDKHQPFEPYVYKKGNIETITCKRCGAFIKKQQIIEI